MSAASRSARKGKVARLPFEIRETINQMIRDGSPAKKLNVYLEEQGYKPLNGANWSNWRHGGYKDWLTEQRRIDEVKKRHESIRRELEAGGFSVLDKAIYEVANDLADSDLDPVKVAGAIAALKSSVTGSKRADTYERRAQLAEEKLDLEREKFRFLTAEKVLKFAKDAKVQAIADDGGTTNDEKIKKLLAYMDRVEAEAVEA